jgi:hypothetical protein
MSAFSSRKSSASIVSQDTKDSESHSLATKTVHRALKSQGREWFDFLAQRMIGIAIFCLVTIHPI